ncbi:pre-mRNA cleavage and polyadenylation factor (CPF) complex subunit [Vermiconidia calcicola]|uniref:Pre-mRNA cleavage and polyadenylation factor (CPF) complex subunit n=1 Tax=Vermiconidia calcicola TaxID=1690605 RepID=A0ACC3MCZ1_9PEZI|nr:pre-mRNA cleavage and polyadenylation factor (CPF) complex subunit [Vermiconidia calcicola]
MDGYHADHGGFDTGRGRGRPSRRNATDIGTTYVHWTHNRRANGRSSRVFEAERPSPSYVGDMLPPAARKGRPADSIPAKHLHSSLNKVRHPVNVVKWTPEGRRLLTASTSGEFTLWNGTGFNFETIMQAHDCAVRAVTYAHNDEWLLSADQDGFVKYWQTNFNNLKSFQAHNDPIRDLAFAPTDSKFVTASDDATLKIFDFATSEEQSTLTGHQWDAKCVDWHPTKGLLVSGSKDHQVKLWDPRTGRCLTTLHGHKNTVAMTKFEPNNGVLLASCARDQTARVFDIRMMRDVFLLKGHEKEISSIAWHPIHSSLLTTAGGDGSMFHYLLDEQNPPQVTAPTLSPYDSQNPSEAPAQTLHPAHKVSFAHEYAIWSMDWHPLGHILASGSNDKVTRFWTRPRPGDDTYTNDRRHYGQAAAEAQGTWRKAEAQRLREEEEAEAEDEADGLVDQKMPSKQAMLPGLPGLNAPMPAPFPDGTSTGGSQGFNMPGFGNGAPPFPMQGNAPDLAKIMEMASGQIPNGAPPGFPPMPPGFQLPPGFQPPPGFPPLPGMGSSATPLENSGVGGGIRKRAPLPSQQESLAQEMRQGRYVKPR